MDAMLITIFPIRDKKDSIEFLSCKKENAYLAETLTKMAFPKLVSLTSGEIFQNGNEMQVLVMLQLLYIVKRKKKLV